MSGLTHRHSAISSIGQPAKVEGFARLGDAAESAIAPYDLPASWRRGLMHAVERVDHALASGRTKTAQIEAVQRALDELTALQRQHFPKTYEEAFAVCREDLRKAVRGRAA